MFAARTVIPINTHFHVRLQVRTGRFGLPTVRPVVRTTNASGLRL